MALNAADGTWAHIDVRYIVKCDKCGQVGDHWNEREAEQLLKRHLGEKHGGPWWRANENRPAP